MAAASRCPDPSDPANDLWWRTYDGLEAIAADAARTAAAARAALAQLRDGHDADLEALADRLDRWWTTRDPFDLTAFDPGADR